MRELKGKPFKLRPHHGLCGEFFRGMGYSGEFAENMKNVLDFMKASDPEVVLTVGTDGICTRCPHNIGGTCETAEKVQRYDCKVLKLCGFSEGDTVKHSELRKAVREKIIVPDRLSDVCGDCVWYEFCKKTAQDG